MRVGVLGLGRIGAFHTATLAGLVDSGLVDELVVADADTYRAHTVDPRPPAAEYIRLSGGIYRDCHIHDFDILRWVTGQEVDTVYATGANRGPAFFAEAADLSRREGRPVRLTEVAR